MRVFKTHYRDKDGKRRQAKKWYLDFSDHRGIRHRWPGLESKEQTEELGRQIKRLIRFTSAGDIPDMSLQQWIETLPKRFLKLLVSVGLLSSHKAAAGTPLQGHIDDFYKSLLAKGDTEKQARQVKTRVKKIIDDCGFRNWSDISASKVHEKISKLRKYVTVVEQKKIHGKKIKVKKLKDCGQLSIKTRNDYLKAIKQFANWMVADRRAVNSPVEYLKGQNANTDRRHDRRALEPDELRRLLEATLAGPERFGMTGYERALLYRFTAETGFRRNEITSLKVSSFNFQNLTVTVKAAYSKHRREDVLPLRADTATELQEFFKGKLPTAKAFGGKYKRLTDKTANMLKADLAETVVKAKTGETIREAIPYIDEAERYADFHCLRHTTGSLLAASGTHPKTAQSLMRHADINLTMSRYTHIFRGQESEAVERLPNLSLPSSQAENIKKTGTDNNDVTEDENSAIYLAKQGRKTDSNSIQQVTVNPILDNKKGLSNTPERTRTSNLRFRRPTLYPIELQAPVKNNYNTHKYLPQP